MSDRRSIGVGVIGLGFMGRTHVRAWQKADAAGFASPLVAVCDSDAGRRRGEAGDAVGNMESGAGGALFDPERVSGYEHPDDLLADPAVEVVSICTPTDSHVPLALLAIAAGKHVLVEKPVAVAASDVARLAAAAKDARVRVMPAMCMRFWPAWRWLKEQVTGGELGAVRSAAFRRLGTRPTWGVFYDDLEKTGGALVDLHIHDADFVRYCFGDPQEVFATGDLDHVTALYRYRSGPAHVTAEGGWDHTSGFPFRMRYTVIFEHATADFDLGRADPLLLCRDGSATPVEVGEGDGYDGEVRHLLDAIRDPRLSLIATVDDALSLAHLLEAERASLDL